MHNKTESIDDPGPGEGDHKGSGDMREPPPVDPRDDQLPSTDDDIDPEDGGGRIEKHTCQALAD